MSRTGDVIASCIVHDAERCQVKPRISLIDELEMLSMIEE